MSDNGDRITTGEMLLLTEWVLQAGQMLELVDLLILEAEENDKVTQCRRLNDLRAAVRLIDESGLNLLTGEFSS